MVANQIKMKRIASFSLVASLLAALLVGCSKKDASSELQKAATTMAQAEANQPVPTPEPVPQTPSTPVMQPAVPSTPKAQAQEMSQALAAYKAGELDDAVIRLQKLRAAPVMSPEKRIAVNDAIAAVMGEIYAMAEKGDARAKQALKTYETMQTRPR
jgi:hypothetical protein